MADAKPGEQPAEGEDEEALPAGGLDVDALRARGDVDALLVAARAYRSGTGGAARDMSRCLDAYRAAAELGSADAEYAVALFHMTGGIVPQDLKEGATRLRAAAEKGSVPAKVYLGNLYELGVHYKADPEKADVWYRNAARSARIDAEPGTDEHARALAELGCARYVLALVESGGVHDESDKARLLQRARAHGYGLRMRGEGGSPDRMTFPPLSAADAPAPLPERERATTTPDTKTARLRKEAEGKRALGERTDANREPADAPRGPSRSALALGAFGYAVLFAVAGVGAGYAATLGAQELVSRGQPLPLLGERAHLVFPIVLGAIGVLPAWLVYRLGAVLKALVMGAALGGVGWVAWGTGTGMLHPDARVQVTAFALAGFLAGLLVLGLLGGTKRQPPRPRRQAASPRNG